MKNVNKVRRMFDEQDADEAAEKLKRRKVKALATSLVAAKQHDDDEKTGPMVEDRPVRKAKKAGGFKGGEVRMIFKRETKGTYFYEAKSDNDFMQSFYLKKSAVPDGIAPKAITLTLE